MLALYNLDASHIGVSERLGKALSIASRHETVLGVDLTLSSWSIKDLLSRMSHYNIFLHIVSQDRTTVRGIFSAHYYPKWGKIKAVVYRFDFLMCVSFYSLVISATCLSLEQQLRWLYREPSCCIFCTKLRVSTG